MIPNLPILTTRASLTILKSMADSASKLTEICTVQGEFKANIVKSRLESEGIPVHLKYESLGPVLGVTVNGLGQVKVMVPAQLADVAKELIDIDAL